MQIAVENNMKSLFITYLIKHKGIALFAMIGLTPVLDWLSIVLGLSNVSLQLLGVVTLVIIIDAITGIAASKRKEEKLTSRKGLQSFWKLAGYTIFLAGVGILGKHEGLTESGFATGLIMYIKLSGLTMAFLWEMHSWGENLEKLYGVKPRLFKFMDAIASAFEMLLINKVKSNVVELKEEKE